MSIDELSNGIGSSRETITFAATEVLAAKAQAEQLSAQFAGLSAESLSDSIIEVASQLDTAHQQLTGSNRRRRRQPAPGSMAAVYSAEATPAQHPQWRGLGRSPASLIGGRSGRQLRRYAEKAGRKPPRAEPRRVATSTAPKATESMRERCALTGRVRRRRALTFANRGHPIPTTQPRGTRNATPRR